MSSTRTTSVQHRTTNWQFSLRTLLLLTVVAGPLLGLGGPPLYRRAVEAIQPPPPVEQEFICRLEPWTLEPGDDSNAH